MSTPNNQQPGTATARIQPKKQTLEDAYSPPANFLEIDVLDPQTHGIAKKRYTDYEVRMRVRKLILKNILNDSGSHVIFIEHSSVVD